MPAVTKNAEGHNVTEWTFQCDLPTGMDLGGAKLDPLILKLGPETMSFEVLCNTLERRFCEAELDCICQCCTEELPDSVCGSCRHAIGFHRCQNPNNSRQQFLWKKGTLHAGALDAQRVLFNLHRKLLPNAALEEKRKAYYEAGLIGKEESFRILQCILQERGTATYLNDGVDEVPEGEATGESSSKLTPTAMKELLNKRVAMMQDGHAGEGRLTDQFRVYSHIINAIETGRWLRLMVQASAGTGKSFLLNTVYLYCLVHEKRCKAAAPTGGWFFHSWSSILNPSTYTLAQAAPQNAHQELLLPILRLTGRTCELPLSTRFLSSTTNTKRRSISASRRRMSPSSLD